MFFTVCLLFCRLIKWNAGGGGPSEEPALHRPVRLHQDHHQRTGAHHEAAAVVRPQSGPVAHPMIRRRSRCHCFCVSSVHRRPTTAVLSASRTSSMKNTPPPHFFSAPSVSIHSIVIAHVSFVFVVWLPLAHPFFFSTNIPCSLHTHTHTHRSRKDNRAPFFCPFPGALPKRINQQNEKATPDTQTEEEEEEETNKTNLNTVATKEITKRKTQPICSKQNAEELTKEETLARTRRL